MNFFSPAEVANNTIGIGKGKANLTVSKMILLGIFAGIFIAFGGLTATTIAVSIPLPSVAKWVGACVFPGGLAMVIVAGAELFTGNCLMPVSLLEKQITFGQMLKNWVFVYIGNLIGSLILAAIAVFSHQFSLFGNGLAVSAISAGVGKCSMPFADAFLKGIACNFLVCIAVWITFASKDVVSKIIGLWFPIMMFVACGFEHSVANMYYIGSALFAKAVPAYADAAVEAGIDMANLTIGNFFAANLLPVTLGNIVGGVAVACVYWFCYVRKKS